ncbi:MAG: hypothetical protein ABDH28_04325 [Brevinematia bacterium]
MKITNMFSLENIQEIFGVSRATIYRILKKAKVEPKNLYTIQEIQQMLPFITTVASIRVVDDKLRIQLKNGNEIEMEQEAIQQIVSKNLIEMRKIETETLISTVSNITTQITDLIEAIKELVKRIVRIEEIILQNAIGKTTNTEELASRRKAISLALDDYIRSNNLLYSNKDDIFIEMLEKFEKDKKVEVRRKYDKMDRSYINTLIRLGLDGDFVKFVRDKSL